MKKLPFLISISHGGSQIPSALQSIVDLSAADLFEDSDAFTRQIFNLRHLVRYQVETDIPRAIVDLNRAVDDLPDKNPDGVIKSMTCYKKRVYKPGRQPDEVLMRQMINKYYHPFHHRIQQVIKNKNLIMSFDCHSMARTGPPISQKPGKLRPLINLGNVFGKSCDPEIVEKLRICLAKAFDFKIKDIKINKPFSGGYITRTYGNKPVPWIQLEINRSLYLEKKWFDTQTGKIDVKRLWQLNLLLQEALIAFFRTTFLL